MINSQKTSNNNLIFIGDDKYLLLTDEQRHDPELIIVLGRAGLLQEDDGKLYRKIK